MGFSEISVLVNGALDQEAILRDIPNRDTVLVKDLDAIVNDTAEFAARYPQSHVEIYVLYHDHEISEEECACVQFLQSHKPAHEWNKPNG
jgi:hypothetical protein